MERWLRESTTIDVLVHDSLEFNFRLSCKLISGWAFSFMLGTKVSVGFPLDDKLTKTAIDIEFKGKEMLMIAGIPNLHSYIVIDMMIDCLNH